MNINSPNELHHFLVGKGITGICPEAQHLVTCMDILSRMCACDPQAAKQARFNQCRQHYIAFASRAQSIAHLIFPKIDEVRIQFYLNNQLISIINR